MDIKSCIKINSNSWCSFIFSFSINHGKYKSFFHIDDPFVHTKNLWYELYDAIENDSYYILSFRHKHECSFIESVGVEGNNMIRFYVSPFGEQDIGFETSIPMIIYKDDMLKALIALLENDIIEKYWL